MFSKTVINISNNFNKKFRKEFKEFVLGGKRRAEAVKSKQKSFLLS